MHRNSAVIYGQKFFSIHLHCGNKIVLGTKDLMNGTFSMARSIWISDQSFQNFNQVVQAEGIT